MLTAVPLVRERPKPFRTPGLSLSSYNQIQLESPGAPENIVGRDCHYVATCYYVAILITGSKTRSSENNIMTSVDTSERWRNGWLTPVIMALTCVFLWGAMFARIADKNISIDKDWLTLDLCGIEMVHPGLHEQQIDLVKKIVAASGDDQAVYRATLRANYCNNYPFTSLSIYLAGKWQTYFGVGPAEDYPTFLTRTLWYGILGSGELLGIACLLGLFFLTTGALRTTIFVTVGLGALYYLTIPQPVTAWFLYQSTPAPPARVVNWINVLGLGLHSWFHPNIPYSPFSVFPRCLCALLSFAAFAIRWSGRPRAAYWVPLLVGGIHQSTALILLVALVSCDLIIRPREFARIGIALPIGVNLLITLLRDRMFAILGFSPSGGMVTVAILLCLVLVLAMLRPVRAACQAGWSFIAAWRDRTIAAVPLPFADALVLFAAWLGLILISYLASRDDAWYRLIYFWSELSPRYIGMFQLSVIAGILYPLVIWMQSARPVIGNVVTASVAVAMLAIATSQVMPARDGFASQMRAAQAYEKTTSQRRDVYAGTSTPTMRDETSWYYLLVRNAILGDRSLTAFFGKT
jgi:hypothetical protein